VPRQPSYSRRSTRSYGKSSANNAAHICPAKSLSHQRVLQKIVKGDQVKCSNSRHSRNLTKQQIADQSSWQPNGLGVWFVKMAISISTDRSPRRNEESEKMVEFYISFYYVAENWNKNYVNGPRFARRFYSITPHYVQLFFGSEEGTPLDILQILEL
jgi:hypothetical protein